MSDRYVPLNAQDVRAKRFTGRVSDLFPLVYFLPENSHVELPEGIKVIPFKLEGESRPGIRSITINYAFDDNGMEAQGSQQFDNGDWVIIHKDGRISAMTNEDFLKTYRAEVTEKTYRGPY